MSPPTGKPEEPPAPDADGRKPYEPPTIECEELFEVLALSCAKMAGQTRACNSLTRVS